MAYTTRLLSRTHTIFQGEDYIEQLKEATRLFRTFDKALDVFLVEQGYQGSTREIEEKVRFITEKCKAAGVPVPRGLVGWFTENKRLERNSRTPFLICFAFGLSVEEAEDFLRRICLARGFDCHSVEEVVYYFGLKKGLSYREVADILNKVPKVMPGRMETEAVIYTDLLVEEIEELETAEELVDYLREQKELFAYNNATAYESIQSLWKEISKQDGLGLLERQRLYMSFDKDEIESGEEADAIEDSAKRKPRKERKRKEDSRFELYLQILGLAGTYAKPFYQERSLKILLEDNELLHPLAADCFPDRDGLNKVLQGEHISYERVRKLLILLVFYKFWVSRALKRGEYEAAQGDGDRCIATLNDNLLSAGYSELYAGNPYDFLMLSAAYAPCPLVMLRDYMREVYFEKMDLDGEYRDLI